MQIKNSKLSDLYKRFMNFIISNYPDAIIDERKNFVMVGYPGELSRFMLSYDNSYECLKIRLSKNITRKLTEDNGRIYYISSLDELNCVKFAVQAVLDMEIPNAQSSSVNTDAIAEAGQGYLLNSDKNLLGIVYINRIPTNAFIHDKDEIDTEQVEIEEEQTRRPTLSRFFKK